MSKKKNRRGTVYLLHFDRPLHHASHYLGWTSDLGERVRLHRIGRGARITRAAVKEGITFRVVRTWENVDRNFERRLKKQKMTNRLCPECGRAQIDKRLAAKRAKRAAESPEVRAARLAKRRAAYHAKKREGK